MRDVCSAAVDAATGAGAEYADARVVAKRNQFVATKNGRVERLADSESEGIGVRVLVNGAWGFACDRRLSGEGAREAALRACTFARAAAGRHSRQLAPVAPASATHRTAVERDPFEVSLDEKVAQCLAADEGMAGPDIVVRQAMVRAQREHKLLLTSEGTEVEQELIECGAGIECAAARDGVFQMRSYPSAHVGSSCQMGWEYVDGLDLSGEAPRIAEQAAALVRADVCPSGVMTVVLDGDQVALQVHESVGHPTELDRVYGSEASYAGTSFLKADDLGSMQYGSDLMNITADPTTVGGLGSFAFDDEGVPAERTAVVEGGLLTGFLTSRETAARIGAGNGGSMRADGWNRMPLVRMTNLHLEPGSGTLDDLLADVSDGVYMETNRSWSIDDKRLNFQFGTQIAWEIKAGKLGRMLRDATYTGITPKFWGTLDAVAGRDSWRLYGLTNCGKGQPGQSAHVSHGAAPARFRDVAGRSSFLNAIDVANAALEVVDGEAEAVAHVEHSGLARFAGSEVHQPTLIENAMVTLRVVQDTRVGVATTNKIDADGLAEVAERARAAARSAPPDDGFPGLAPPADPPKVEGFDEDTARLGPEEQAKLADAAIEAGGDVPVYGFFTSAMSELAVASSTGLSVEQRMTDATALVVAADENGSGYAEQTAWRAGGIDPALVAQEAAEKARRTRGGGEIEPGVYRAVLEPYAFADLLDYFSHDSFGALGLLEERSYFAGRLGEKVFDEKISITDDALDPRGLPKAFDFEGTPKQRVALVEHGVARGVVWDRTTAAQSKNGAQSTGHAPPAELRDWGPLPSALSVSPGEAESVEELAELVGDGLYITRLHYLGVVHPREGVITGMTRDGTFRIRDGKIAEPLVNLRFTVAVPDFLRDVLGLTSRAALVNSQNFYGERYPYGVLTPAIAAERFAVTGVGSKPGI